MPDFTFFVEPLAAKIHRRVFGGSGDTMEAALKAAYDKIEPVMWKIQVRNEASGETIEFLGQSEAITEAVKNGAKSATEIFRPKNDGKMREPPGCSVKDRDGKPAPKSFKEWEAGAAPTPAVVDEEF